MRWRLAFAPLLHRPWRSALLLLGYGLGVGVMIVLLSVGEAMMAQARDEKLVGGGDVTVLPDGIDVEVMKTGGVGGLWFSIPNARFVYRQILAAPRLADDVAAVAPQVAEKLVYLRANGREVAARAIGELPSATAAVGGSPTLVAGRWEDAPADAAWRQPSPSALLHEIDRFHYAPASRSSDERASWGEWHYFNVVGDDGAWWAYVSLLVGGDVPHGEWGGQVLVTLHERGRAARRFSARVPSSRVRLDTARADLAIGPSTVTVTDAGTYRVAATAPAERGGAPVTVALEVVPAPRQYFPGASIAGGELVSGYAVPGLRATANGRVCVGADCRVLRDAQAYHDHNWGLWRNVQWEWGTARAGAFTLLYGVVREADAEAARAPLFLYVTDSLGFRALFRPPVVAWDDAHVVRTADGPLRVPARAVLEDARGGDTLRLELAMDDWAVTDTRLGLVERGDPAAARRLSTPWFVQMAGTAALSGRLGGVPVQGRGRGFFETYR
jgi:hypothetical protein